MITETARPEVAAPPRSAAPRPVRIVVAIAVVVVVIGLVLRFWTRSHLWLDEALTVNIASLPLRRIPAALRHDGAPPAYYVLLHFWIRAFGTSAFSVRALSGGFAVASLPAMWFAGRRVAGGADRRVVGVVAVVLLATSPFAIRYATETRMYSMVVFLVLLGYLALARILERERPRWPDVVGFGLISGVLLLTHYWSLYLLVVVAAMLAVQALRAAPARRHRYRVAFLALAAGSLLFVAWLPTFWYQLRHTGTPWSDPATFGAMVNAISEFAGGRSSSGRALGLAFFALAGFGLFGAAVDRTKVEVDLRTRPRGRGLAIVVAGTLAIAIAAGFASGGAFAARYAAVVFPPFLLLVALGTTVFMDRRILGGVVAAAAVFGLITASGNVRTDRSQAGQIAAVLRAQFRPGDVIGYCPDQLGPATARLLPAAYDQVTFPRRTGPKFVNWVDYSKVNEAADPDAFARFLDAAAGPQHTVWLVWASQYRTFGAKCEEIAAQLGTLRPGANQLLEADTQHFYEHANLVRFPLR
jgi:mannosyltransferase